MCLIREKAKHIQPTAQSHHFKGFSDKEKEQTPENICNYFVPSKATTCCQRCFPYDLLYVIECCSS